MLPSLAVVLIGFTIFSIIIVSAYTTYDMKKDYIKKFEVSEAVLEKIYSPHCVFIEDSSIINLNSFRSKDTWNYISALQQTYIPYGFNFSLKLSYKDDECCIPQFINENSFIDSFACSKKVTVKINEISLVPGTLTILFWEENNMVD